MLAPDDDDYFVLKVKHSAFHATPLDLLLRHLGARKLLITGVSSEQCVLYSAADARMLDYQLVVPADCVASQTDGGKADALRHLERVLGCRTAASAEIELPLTDHGGN